MVGSNIQPDIQFDSGAGMFGGGMGGSGAPEQKERQGSPKGPGVDMSKKKIIIPLTISMLENAERDQNEALVIDGVEISNVSLLGRIMEISQEQLKINLLINDDFGCLNLVVYKKNEEEESDALIDYKYVKGGYAKIIGTIRTFKGKVGVIANRVRNVTTGNEITCHMMSVITHSCMRRFGPLSEEELKGEELADEVPKNLGQQLHLDTQMPIIIEGMKTLMKQSNAVVERDDLYDRIQHQISYEDFSKKVEIMKAGGILTNGHTANHIVFV